MIYDGKVALIDLSIALIWIAAGGTFGGFVDFIIRLRYEGLGFFFMNERLTVLASLALLVISGITGIGGALAIQFVLITLGKFPSGSAGTDQLLLLALSTVSGFSRKWLLPQISNQLERIVTEVQQNREATEKAKEEALNAQDLSKVASALGKAPLHPIVPGQSSA